MKVRCAREPLLAALQGASAVVPARSPKPVLMNVKLEVDSTSAVLLATDLEVGIRIQIEGVETIAAGAVLLPSSRLAAIVRESLPGTVFEMYSDGNATVVKRATQSVSPAGRRRDGISSRGDVSSRAMLRTDDTPCARTREENGLCDRQ